MIIIETRGSERYNSRSGTESIFEYDVSHNNSHLLGMLKTRDF